MIYLKPPVYLNSLELENIKNNAIFLAGSITNARDWQAEAYEALKDHFHVINPRRDNCNNLDPDVEREQIIWEEHYLERVKNILFYFSDETLAPITLFEYGVALKALQKGSKQNLFVCIHPKYKRINDILIQTELKSHDLRMAIHFDLNKVLRRINEMKKYLVI